MNFLKRLLDNFSVASMFFGAAIMFGSFAWVDYSSFPRKIETEMFKTFSTQMDEKFAAKLANCVSKPVASAVESCSLDKDNLLSSMERCVSSDQLRELEVRQALQLCVLKINHGRL